MESLKINSHLPLKSFFSCSKNFWKQNQIVQFMWERNFQIDCGHLEVSEKVKQQKRKVKELLNAMCCRVSECVTLEMVIKLDKHSVKKSLSGAAAPSVSIFCGVERSKNCFLITFSSSSSSFFFLPFDVATSLHSSLTRAKQWERLYILQFY